MLKLILLAALMALANLAQSADMQPATPVDTELQRARALISQKNWPAAVVVLEPYVVTKPKSADGFNLLGYSYRNLTRLDEALVAYKTALSLDPDHRGAHEYIGMAYLQLGQMDKARQHLSALDKLCRFSCEEYRDLKKAVDTAAK